MYQIRHWLPSSWVSFSLWVWGPPAVMWRNRQIHAVILHGNRRPAVSSQLPVFPRDGGWQSVKKGSCVRGCMLRKYVFSYCMFLCLCRPASAVRGWIQSRKRLCKKHPKVISVGLWQEWGEGLEEGGGGWMSWSSLLKPAATCLHVLNLWNVFLPETMRRRFLLLLPTLFMELAADWVNVNRRNGSSLSVCLHEVGSDLKLHCTLLKKKRNTPMSSSPPPLLTDALKPGGKVHPNTGSEDLKVRREMLHFLHIPLPDGNVGSDLPKWWRTLTLREKVHDWQEEKYHEDVIRHIKSLIVGMYSSATENKTVSAGKQHHSLNKNWTYISH